MQIIVLGMHRSGTSLVTRLINMMGAYFGPESINVGAHEDNPKGFWERLDVMKINIEILKRANANWAKLSEIDFSKIAINEQNDLISSIKKTIKVLDAHRPWVIKDPRFCITFPFWQPFFEKSLIVLIYRDPIQIAQSLKTRNNFPINFSISLWEEYMETAFNAIKDIPKIILFHRDFFHDPIKATSNLLQDLQKRGVIGLKMPSDKEINTFIDPKLYREKGDKRLQRKYISLAQGDLLNAIEEKNEKNIYQSINNFDFKERHLQLMAFENLIFSKKKPCNVHIHNRKIMPLQEKRIIGHLDKISRNSVYGWASYLNDETPVGIKLYVNNKMVKSKLAKDFRKGIKIKGIHPTGNCGFHFELEGNQVLKQNDKISVKAGKRDIELTGSPKIFDSEEIKELPGLARLNLYKGRLDNLRNEVIHGWAKKEGESNPVSIDIIINNKLVKTIKADQYRKDLDIKKIGHGKHAFSLNLSPYLAEEKQYIIQAKVSGAQYELNKSPVKIDINKKSGEMNKDKGIPENKQVITKKLINISQEIIMGWSPKNRHISSFNFINRNKKIIMGWSPKAGCTVANKMFFESAGCLEEALSYGQWIHNYDPIYSSQNPVTLKDMQRADFYKFKIVRNPFNRVVSSYAHAMFFRYAEDNIKSVLKIDDPNNITFMQFLDYLGKIDLSATDRHHELQKLVNSGEGTLYKYDYICKLEFLEEGVKVINNNSMADFKFKLEKNKLEREHLVTKIMSFNDSAYDKSFLEISSIKKGIKKVPDIKFFYNKEIIKRVSELYKEDISEYDYSYDLER